MKKLLPILSVVVLSFTFLVYFYSDVLFAPNAYMFDGSGDAVKNYYTFAFQLRDSSTTNMNGMNYPYGENFLYTDGHPLLCIVLKPIVHLFPATNDYLIGLLNSLMLLSMLITPLVLYLLLRKFKVETWFAVLCSIAINTLAPQVYRLTGHFALSYSIAIPLTWLLILQFQEKGKWAWLLVLCANNTVWLLTHAYLGMMLTLFTGIYLTIYAMRPDYLKRVAHILVAFILPMLFFLGIKAVTDIHEGRTTNPIGFFDGLTSCESVFASGTSPFSFLYGSNFTAPWEALSYVGLLTNVCIISLLIYIIPLVRRRNYPTLEAFYTRYEPLVVAFMSATVILIIAFGFPFKLCKPLLDIFSYAKNFKSICRFTWVFYFVATICSAVFYNNIIARSKHRAIAVLLFIAVPSIYFVEGIYRHSTGSEFLRQNRNLFVLGNVPTDMRQVIDEAEKEHYQAILTIPFYYKGSDYALCENDPMMADATIVSYHTGIPLLGADLTRISIPESKKHFQMLAPGFYKKDIASDIKQRGTVLIFHMNADAISDADNLIISKATLVLRSEKYTLYCIAMDSLLRYDVKPEIASFKKRTNLVEKQGFMVTDTSAFLSYLSFDSLAAEHVHLGKGALQSKYAGFTCTKAIAWQKRDTGNFVMSFWIYGGGFNHGQDKAWVLPFVQSVKAGKINWDMGSVQQTRFIDGDWDMVEIPFKADTSMSEVCLCLNGNEDNKNTLIIDDVLLRKASVDVYKIINNDSMNVLFHNDHLINMNDAK